LASAPTRVPAPAPKPTHRRPVPAPSVVGPTSSPGSPGRPLPASVAVPISSSLGVDVSPVRVHTDARAAGASEALNARAFAFGSHVFLGSGEQPTDLGLMAHEVSHVVQQASSPRVQLFSPGGSDALEQEAHTAAAAVVQRRSFSVQGRTRPRVQRLGLGDVRNKFADWANVIPGYRMLTILIGINPINMAPVPRTPANIFRALIEFIPGGGLVTKALDNYGIFDKIATWVDQQVSSLGVTAGMFIDAIKEFIAGLHLSDVFNLGDVWERAKRIFTGPIDKLIAFAKGLITGIIKFIKDAILMPLAKLAEGTRGWDLLIAVLGRNPITGDAVPRNAQTLIPGFLKLIGQEEVWANMQKSNAIGRAWAWFQGAMAALMGFVGQIPALFIAALKSLTLEDIILVPLAFAKVGKVFGNFIGDFISWGLKAVWNLLEIIFDVVSPGALGYIKKTGAALKSILKNPLPFVGNLVKAAKLGFQNFASNFGTHLKAGLIDWLTGSLPGIYIPKGFSLVEIAKFVFSVLGLTWQNIRQKLVKATSETIVKAMETGFDIVKTLVTGGAAAAWEKIKEQLSNLKDMAIGAITDFVVDMVVKKALPKLIAMFIPGAGFISAILSIYDTVMVFVNKIKTIIQVVTGFIDSIVAIAAGAIGAAASKVEGILARLLSLAINFLAGFAGLGKVADKVMGIIQKIRAPIDKALDWLIGWIVGMAKKLFSKVFGKDGQPDKRTDAEKKAALHSAVLEGQSALKQKDATPDTVKAKLPSIQAKFKLTSLTLAPAPGGKYQIVGAVNPDEKSEQVALGADYGATVGQALIVMVGGEWKLATIDPPDQQQQLVWSKFAGGRIAYPYATFKASFTGGFTIARPFDPNSKGNGKYKNLPDPPDVGPFKEFTGTQKAAVIKENRARNQGSLRSDASSGELVLTTKRAKGSTVNPNEVNIDHIFPRSQGGWNSYANAQVLSFSENLKKLDKIPDAF
jgi:hypothetical protein